MAVTIPIRLTTVISSPIEKPRRSARILLPDLKTMTATKTDNLCNSLLRLRETPAKMRAEIVPNSEGELAP
jgi:hypothetical protein